MRQNLYRYKVKDSYGNVMRVFDNYITASDYKFIYGNSGWTIESKLIKRMTYEESYF